MPPEDAQRRIAAGFEVLKAELVLERLEKERAA
jgi:hypothetical protein